MDISARFEWDDAKAASNLNKHGITFPTAIEVFEHPQHIVIATRRSADRENRQKVVGKIGGRLFTAVFVMRDGTCRIMSARRANRGEERAYGHR